MRPFLCGQPFYGIAAAKLPLRPFLNWCDALQGAFPEKGAGGILASGPAWRILQRTVAFLFERWRALERKKCAAARMVNGELLSVPEDFMIFAAQALARGRVFHGAAHWRADEKDIRRAHATAGMRCASEKW